MAGGRITIDIAGSVPSVQGLPDGMVFHQGHRPYLAELIEQAGLNPRNASPAPSDGQLPYS
jgi:hypothetical protein